MLYLGRCYGTEEGITVTMSVPVNRMTIYTKNVYAKLRISAIIPFTKSKNVFIGACIRFPCC